MRDATEVPSGRYNLNFLFHLAYKFAHLRIMARGAP